MKFIHLADLHFGKQLHGQSLLEDQRDWVRQCLETVRAEQPAAVLISGDVYDRSQPAGSARELAGDFFTALCEAGPAVLMIAGNHDSPENIGYLRGLLRRQGLHAAGVAEAELDRVRLEDAYGPVNFYLMPYLFPARVSELLDEELHSYDEAARALLARQAVNREERNVLLAHQTVLSRSQAPERGGSETSVGGIGEMNAGVFDDFDYVALGHIHKGQSIGREAVRYAGAPMCYHFDEAAAGKGILVVELGEKGSAPVLRTVPVKPLHPLRNISGTVEDILAGPEGQHGEYIHVRLIGQDVTKERAAALEAFFRTRGSRLLLLDRQVAERGEADRERGEYRERSLEEYFCDYCEELRGAPPEEAELRIIRGAAELLEQMQAGGFDESSRERSAAKLAELVKREVLA